MNDLIRRDDLLDLYKVKEEYRNYSVPLPVIIQNIKDMPAVDAVAVVRCKDCKNYLPDNHNFAKHCRLSGTEMDKDGYCSYGERRDNAID